MEEEKEITKRDKKIGKEIYLFIFLFVLLVAGLSTLSFAFYRQYQPGGGSIDSNNTITTGDILFAYSDAQGENNSVPGNGIQIINALPMSDDEGKLMLSSRSYFDFQIIASPSKNKELEYQIILEKLANSTLLDSDIKVYVTNLIGSTEYPITETLNLGAVKVYSQFDDIKEDDFSGKILFQRTVSEKNYQQNYRLRLWIRNNASDYYNKTFSARVNVKAYTKVS